MATNSYNPLVSIILPSYNRAKILKRAIQSVIDQTFSDFELIIVDDCSKDNTEEVVKNFHDHRIKLIRHERNKGAVAARNTGIKASKGKYVAFQDSDDEWLPQKLEKQIKVFEQGPSNLGVVYTSFWLIDGNQKRISPPAFIKHTEGDIHRTLLEYNFIGTPMAVVRRESFEKEGLFENLPRLQEWDLWLRISKRYRFAHINEPLAIAYLQQDSISRNVQALIHARKFILKRYFQEISKEPKLLKHHYFEIGTMLCQNGRIQEGRGYFFHAMRIDPIDFKLQLSIISSLFGQKLFNKIVTNYLKAKKLPH